MSTVPEVIVARQCGLRVAGCSCITNAAAGLGGKAQVVSAEEVLEVAKAREQQACDRIGAFVQRLGGSKDVSKAKSPKSPASRPAKKQL